MTRRNQDVADLVIFKDTNKFSQMAGWGRLYVVYSYGEHWPLFIYDLRDARWFGNESTYGATTSKHKTLCQPHTSTPITWMPTNAMLSYIGSVNRQEALDDLAL
jgi:hypothetical protein